MFGRAGSAGGFEAELFDAVEGVANGAEAKLPVAVAVLGIADIAGRCVSVCFDERRA